jgi:formate dehydrogenase maturation protein FdhE
MSNNEFKNEVFSSYNPNPIRSCSHCGSKPAPVLSMLNPRNGRTVRMFKCECGEQTWAEDKK